MSTIRALCDAIVGELNTEFGEANGFTAERRYQTVYELRELEGLKVAVVPISFLTARINRAEARTEPTIAICFDQRLAKPDPAHVDPLADLVEEIALHFRGLKIADDATVIEASVDNIAAPDWLEEQNRFSSAVVLTLKVM